MDLLADCCILFCCFTVIEIVKLPYKVISINFNFHLSLIIHVFSLYKSFCSLPWDSLKNWDLTVTDP